LKKTVKVYYNKENVMKKIFNYASNIAYFVMEVHVQTLIADGVIIKEKHAGHK